MIIYNGSNTRFLPKPKIHSLPIAKIYEKPMVSKTKQTLFFTNPVSIVSGASVVAKREGAGPLGDFFDKVIDADAKKKNFEEAELAMLKHAINLSIDKANLFACDIELMLAGDLLNQLTTSSYTARDLSMPFLGLYSACSTITECLGVGASLINAGYFNRVVCATSSHFATAERQYRSPLEYGAQRPPYAQWTVTGAGSTVLASSGAGANITSATFGKVIDFGIKDASNMGAAMAPAALNTLLAMLIDTGLSVSDFDLIATGDLGRLGSSVFRDLCLQKGICIGTNYIDCGAAVYANDQKCYQGGSGAGCSATVFNSFILDRINSGHYKRVALLATGALMSAQSVFQGESIPSISHGVIIENF